MRPGLVYPTRDRSASSQVDAPGAYFDERRARLAVHFFESYLRHSTGEWAGRPFILDPWQRQIAEDLWGWRRANGSRLYRQAFVAVPRKNGKTTYAGGVALALTLADGEPGAQVYSIAGNKDQARIVFDEACNMVAQSPALSDKCEALRKWIYCPELGSFFAPLAARASNQHGKNPHGVIGDEVHAWKDREQFDVMRTALGARRQPLEFYITTAGHNRETLAWQLWKKALDVRAGISRDPYFLPVIFAADPSDDWQDPAIWAKANPGLGAQVSLDYIRAQCAAAKEDASHENPFKQLHLNLWTEQAIRWLSMEAWNSPENEKPFAEDDLIGRPCFMGLDLAWTRDLNAIALVFPPHGPDPAWRVIIRFFVPEDGLRLRAQRDFVPYDQWVAQGFMLATPGNVADFRAVLEEADALARKFKPNAIAFDPYMAGTVINELSERGLQCVGVRQGYLSMALPCAELERAVMSRTFRHGANPVLTWNASNVVVTRDERGNMKPDHRKSNERIDGLQAVLTAMALACDKAAAPRSVYEREGRRLLIL